MTLVWSDIQIRRAHTPTLDHINELLSTIERDGHLSARIQLGRQQSEALPAEIAAVQAEGIIVDPIDGPPDTLWGVPVGYADEDSRLAVAREEQP